MEPEKRNEPSSRINLLEMLHSINTAHGIHIQDATKPNTADTTTITTAAAADDDDDEKELSSKDLIASKLKKARFEASEREESLNKQFKQHRETNLDGEPMKRKALTLTP